MNKSFWGEAILTATYLINDFDDLLITTANIKTIDEKKDNQQCLSQITYIKNILKKLKINCKFLNTTLRKVDYGAFQMNDVMHHAVI